MLVLIAYDVNVTTPAGRRRLRRISRLCLDRGQRVQGSVYECLVEPAQWTALRQQLIKEIDPAADSLRFYMLGKNWKRRVEHVGAKKAYDPEGPLII
ncbi:MAG: CRISPR-associated endoribonuclease Cas2 [Phycisphaerae bacterium]|nr:CRISPR-associated endoribonuclease Cas2 [Phycisphaerae bacterium]